MPSVKLRKREILSEARFYVTRYIYMKAPRTDPDNLVSKGLDFYTMRRCSSSCETDRLATDDTLDVKLAADYRAPEAKIHLMRDSEMRRSCPTPIYVESFRKDTRENKPARPTITSPRSYFSPVAASRYIPDAKFILKYTVNEHFSAKLFLSVDVSNLSKFAMLFIIDMISLSTVEIIALTLQLFSACVTHMRDTIMKMIDVVFKTGLMLELFSACVTCMGDIIMHRINVQQQQQQQQLRASIHYTVARDRPRCCI
uniref:Uncharacterized protein n=1 Tax=Trichogramma kaykai TaxID=54128 RepID=A0ABD2VW90_9HYME